MKKRPALRFFIGLLAAVLLFAPLSWILGDPVASYRIPGGYRSISARDSFGSVERHPAFSDFSAFILPWKDTVNQVVTPALSLDFVCRQNRTNTASIVDGFNFVAEASQREAIFYPIYTEAERAADPSLEETGLILIRGEPGMPVAVLTSGGGFSSVCLFMESFPVGRVLHRMGYTVAMPKYRVDPAFHFQTDDPAERERTANADFSRALAFLFENQQSLWIDMTDYSVWGFSAGGRTTWLWGLDEECGYAAHGLPAPAAMVLVYSGWYDEARAGHYGAMPPCYFAWLPEDDVIGAENAAGIGRMIDELRTLGIPCEESRYHQAKHGFGEGRGTDAEGWIEIAVSFWETQR